MPFGYFVFSISGDPDGDYQAIDDTLREVEKSMWLFGDEVLPLVR